MKKCVKNASPIKAPVYADVHPFVQILKKIFPVATLFFMDYNGSSIQFRTKNMTLEGSHEDRRHQRKPP